MPRHSEIAIVDCGAGNVRSVFNALWRAGAEPAVAATAEDVAAADRLVLPGVGAAGFVLASLRQRHLDGAVREAVLDRGRPFLGICVGMQILADRCHEHGCHDAWGWTRGDVRPIGTLASPATRVPHTGFNDIQVAPTAPAPLRALGRHTAVYFCHSFALAADGGAASVAVVEYGVPLVAAIACGPWIGVQFHPEKSQVAGARLLEAFLTWSP